jgi:hypothetical protein
MNFAMFWPGTAGTETTILAVLTNHIKKAHNSNVAVRSPKEVPGI